MGLTYIYYLYDSNNSILRTIGFADEYEALGFK